MQFILLGFGLGLVSLLAPGPISLGLIEITLAKGRRAGLVGAAGVASGDLAAGSLAATIVLSGSALPGAFFAALAKVSAVFIAAIGLALLAHPSRSQALAASVKRPGRALFAATTFSPSALGGWIAMMAAMPFASEVTAVIPFMLGIVIASTLWHPVLAVLVAVSGQWLDYRRRIFVTRLGGTIMAGLGAALMLTN